MIHEHGFSEKDHIAIYLESQNVHQTTKKCDQNNDYRDVKLINSISSTTNHVICTHAVYQDHSILLRSMNIYDLNLPKNRTQSGVVPIPTAQAPASEPLRLFTEEDLVVAMVSLLNHLRSTTKNDDKKYVKITELLGLSPSDAKSDL